jgi:hypothetical protein
VARNLIVRLLVIGLVALGCASDGPQRSPPPLQTSGGGGGETGGAGGVSAGGTRTAVTPGMAARAASAVRQVWAAPGWTGWSATLVAALPRRRPARRGKGMMNVGKPRL